MGLIPEICHSLCIPKIEAIMWGIENWQQGCLCCKMSVDLCVPLEESDFCINIFKGQDGVVNRLAPLQSMGEINEIPPISAMVDI